MLVAALALFIVHSALAADAPAPFRVLTLDSALVRAATRSARVSAADLSIQSAQARATAAGRRPNPALEASLENFAGSLGTDRTEATLQLSQPLERGGDRPARSGLAAAEIAAARSNHALTRQQVQAAVLSDFVAAWAAHERVRLLAQARELGADAIARAGERVRAGAASPVERARAEAAAAFVEAEVAEARAQAAVADRALALHWNSTQADFDSLALPAAAPSAPDGAGSLERLAAHPQLGAAAAEVGLAEARVRLARAARASDLEASVGVRHLRDVPGTGLVAAVSMPLTLFGSPRGDEQAARLDASRARTEASAARVRLESELHSALDQLRHASAAQAQLRDRAVPAALEALATLRAGFAAGRWTYTDLAEAQRAALDAQLALVAATAQAWSAHAAVQSLTGSLDTNGSTGGAR